MIVCVCHNVSDRKIRQAVEEGMDSLAAVRKNLNVGTCCGKCHSCAKEVIRAHVDKLASTSRPMFDLLPIAA